MKALLAAIRKELLLLIRDWHALALLFVMPLVFITIMSLALQERFGTDAGVQLAGQVHDLAGTGKSRAFLAELTHTPHLSLNSDGERLSHRSDLFAITLQPHFDQSLAGTEAGAGVLIDFAPELGRRERMLVTAAVREAFAIFNSTLIAEELGYDRAYAESEFLRLDFIATESDAPGQAPTPSAVQQNVPAWLIFAMFFVAVPLSTAVIGERQNRTLTRVKTFGRLHHADLCRQTAALFCD